MDHFNAFIENEFRRLKGDYPENSPEYQICDFYSHNFEAVFLQLQTSPTQSKLSEVYHACLKQTLQRAEMHTSFLTGIWIPMGNLRRLGVQPEIGFQFGTKYKKMNYDMILIFRPGKAANRYQARRTRTSDWESTTHLQGGYIGIDIGRDLIAYRKNEIQLTGGVGLDVLQPFPSSEDSEVKSGGCSSYNFNLGFGYRYYLKDSWYVGLRTKYNIVDYTLSGSLDRSCNPITVQLSTGIAWNPEKKKRLKELKYRYR